MRRRNGCQSLSMACPNCTGRSCAGPLCQRRGLQCHRLQPGFAAAGQSRPDRLGSTGHRRTQGGFLRGRRGGQRRHAPPGKVRGDPHVLAYGHRHTGEVIQELGLTNVSLTMTSVDLVRGVWRLRMPPSKPAWPPKICGRPTAAWRPKTRLCAWSRNSAASTGCRSRRSWPVRITPTWVSTWMNPTGTSSRSAPSTT
jgi:hypothetical protein